MAVGASAQFVPGKERVSGVVTEYRKVSGDSVRPRIVKERKEKTSRKRSSSGKKSTGKNGVKTKKKGASRVEYEPVGYSLGERVIMRGDSGRDVRAVARILVNKIYIEEDSLIYTEGGGVLYDGELVRAVKRFQRLNGFCEDGIIGRELIKALRKRR